MCGIAGIVLARAGAVSDPRRCLLQMREAMHHRGPDGAGLFLSSDGRAGLVNRRLAIRDLSPAGHMPMAAADGAIQVTHNGEIYNTEELRLELEAHGHTFRSRSDTEVILHGYETWGAEVVEHLRGMFAFAILDTRPGAGQLLLARDRLGIKPLYHAWTPEVFLFASEIKALMAPGLLSRELSPAGLVGYLLLGAVPTPHTIYRDIAVLEPGTTLSVSIGGPVATPRSRRYWSMPEPSHETLTHDAAVEAVRGRLTDAVQTHLVSDVPLGAFLSGGLDSSAVVALMRQATRGPIRTCAMIFEEPGYSEASYARAVADVVGAEHHERIVSAANVAAELPRIFAAMDQPSIDGVNSYFVAQTAREAGLTVALSGLGGDELFGGYPNTFHGVPRLVRATSLAQAIPGGAAITRGVLKNLTGKARWRKVIDALDRPASPASAYLACRGLFSPREVQSLVSPDLWQAAASAFDPVGHVAAPAGVPECSAELFSWVSRAELGTYTRDQLLRDTDVMSMAHSLEVRVPLLDDRLVETMLRLPDVVKQNGGPPKRLLLDAMGQQLPEAVRSRRGKQGFTFPFDRWLRGPLRCCGDGWETGLGKVLQTGALQRVRESWDTGRLHWSRLWAIAVLDGWNATSRSVWTSAARSTV